MSDKSNLANTNNEPSMEDILSSIRKVIAEDLINEDTPAASSEDGLADIADDTEEFPIVNETIALTDGGTEPVVTDALEGSTPDTEDILELDTILTELPDPYTLTDEQGEVLELVTLEDDLIDSNLDLPDTREEALQEDITLGSESSAKLADEATAMDMVMATNASVLAQSAKNDEMDFDETLDLVMDSDASDYVTANIASSTKTSEMEIEDWRDRAAFKSDELNLSQNTDTDLQAVVDKAVAETVAETVAEEALSEETIAETDHPAIFASDLIDEDLPDEDLLDEDLDEAIFEESELQPVVATPDEDMDLVKSLLDDLMDEPAPEGDNTIEAFDSAEIDDTIEADFTNEILFREEPGHSLDEQDMIIPEPELSFDPETEVENTLAQIAKDIKQSNEVTAEISDNPDDVVTLETPDLVSKLALASSAAIGGGAIAASTTDNEPEEIPEHPVAETKTESQPEQDQAPQPNLQEEEAMPTPLKSETLIDTDTQEEAGNAFASLTTAVREKAIAEENGPPIGELVKEALKPMLQEWLDANLKTMVQRAVTKEIKRISSGK